MPNLDGTGPTGNGPNGLKRGCCCQSAEGNNEKCSTPPSKVSLEKEREVLKARLIEIENEIEETQS